LHSILGCFPCVFHVTCAVFLKNHAKRLTFDFADYFSAVVSGYSTVFDGTPKTTVLNNFQNSKDSGFHKTPTEAEACF